jgi:hypothetical protein
MIGTLYRYPHPHDPTRFIYVGQGPNRDKRHRLGNKGFGHRFKNKYPNDVLPEPIKEQIKVSCQLELNEEEIIWMFRFHTWRGYPDGQNLTLPGSQDYKKFRLFVPHEALVRGGQTQGRRMAESGKLQQIGNLPQTKKGQSKNCRTIGLMMASVPGHLARIGRLGSREDKARAGRLGGSISGYIVCCLRWNIRRGKSCTCGTHKTVTI